MQLLSVVMMRILQYALLLKFRCTLLLSTDDIIEPLLFCPHTPHHIVVSWVLVLPWQCSRKFL